MGQEGQEGSRGLQKEPLRIFVPSWDAQRQLTPLFTAGVGHGSMMEARPAGWFPLSGRSLRCLRRGVGQQLDDFLIKVACRHHPPAGILHWGAKSWGQAGTAALTGTRRHITSMTGDMQIQVPDEGKRAESESARGAPGSTRWRGMRGRNARTMWEGRKARGCCSPLSARALVRAVSSCSVSGDAQRWQTEVDDTAHDGCCSPGVTGILSLRSLSMHYIASHAALGRRRGQAAGNRDDKERPIGAVTAAVGRQPVRCGGCPPRPSTLLHAPPRAWEPGAGLVVSCMNSCRRTLGQKRRPRCYSVLGSVPRVVGCSFVGGAERAIPETLPWVVEAKIQCRGCEWDESTSTRPGRRKEWRHEFMNLHSLGLGLYRRYAPRACRACTPEPSLLGAAHPTKPSCYRWLPQPSRATPRFEVGDTSLGKSTRRESTPRAGATLHSPTLARDGRTRAISAPRILLEGLPLGLSWALASPRRYGRPLHHQGARQGCVASLSLSGLGCWPVHAALLTARHSHHRCHPQHLPKRCEPACPSAPNLVWEMEGGRERKETNSNTATPC